MNGIKTTNSNNLTWFKSLVSRRDRERLHGHRGAVLWFTGLSASGKSTIAHFVERELHRQGCSTYVFDGDNVRHGLCSDLAFSPEDRRENIRRIGEMVKLFVDAGIIVLTAFISPGGKERNSVRSLFSDSNFFEIYVDCPVEVCESRDQKGIYGRARKGEIKNFTGISASYEVPQNPDLIIRSDELSVEEAAACVLELIRENKIINSQTFPA